MRWSHASALALGLTAAAAFAQPCTELPILYILQDKSGSMAGVPDPVNAPSAPSKWDSASAVVPSIASQFANRFRFGVGMFPQQSTTFNCATGGTVMAVPSSASAVQSAYLSAAPGGGTPTAATLDAVRTSLTGLGGSAPRYVLLITDGLPNCNLANDPYTCATTTSGCLNLNTCSGSSCCGLGAKDCLDDNATVQAASRLRTAGIPVYVVGFGAGLTSGNNKAVLDAVASAGGTGSAYLVSNQTALASALSQIAQNTATCCQNACTQGAARCNASGQRELCQLDTTSCTRWVATDCPTRSTCQGGSCVSCSDACSLGASRCANGNAEQCVTATSGCTEWRTAEVCSYGELCSGGQCGTCQGCSIGASRCTATGVEQCDWDILSGCTTWTARACASGSTCQSGACTSCNGACTAGTKRCAGNGVETCVANASGCTAWQPTETCASFCSGGACGTCGTSCAPGATRCNGNGVETCGTDANDCPAWGATTACPANSVCATGACQACATSCTEGSRRCGANGAVEVCALDATGCTAWTQTGACNVGAGERCDNGLCVPPCQDACDEGAATCISGAPRVCVRQPSGCTGWRDEPACATGAACVLGACHPACDGGEIETCGAGLVCTGTPDGRVCLPGGTSTTPPASTPPPATTPPSQVTPEDGGGTTSIGANAGCSSVPFLAWPAAWLPLCALRRRRR